jgi:calcineurin-like phosphoesterase family protein
MIYFISDTHFGHKNIVGYCKRPFQTTEEMDDAIIASINNTVKPKDNLYFLGDFCHKGGDPKKYRKKIQCDNIHVVLGNHDNQDKFSKKDFSSIDFMKEIIYCNQKIILFHYPMRAWNKSNKKSWMLYGHVHGRLHREDMLSGRFTLDVGVDNKREGVGFGTPWSFKDIQQQFLARAKNFSSPAIDKPDTMLYNRRNNTR